MVGVVVGSSKMSSLIVDDDLDMGAYQIISPDAISSQAMLKEASEDLRNSHDAEVGTYANTAYEKKKTITLDNGISGVLTFKFALWSNSGINETYGKIYKNGVALGTEQHHSDSGTYNTYSEDLNVGTMEAGDTLELWAKVDSTNTGKCKELRLYYKDSTGAVAATNS
jgi:hypothetical protein